MIFHCYKKEMTTKKQQLLMLLCASKSLFTSTLETTRVLHTQELPQIYCSPRRNWRITTMHDEEGHMAKDANADRETDP